MSDFLREFIRLFLKLLCRRLEGRDICPQCQKSRKYYCYSCFRLVGLSPTEVPHVALPTKVHV